MGIQGLTKLLSDHAPGCMREQKFEAFLDRKVAIDASMHIYQFMCEEQPFLFHVKCQITTLAPLSGLTTLDPDTVNENKTQDGYWAPGRPNSHQRSWRGYESPAGNVHKDLSYVGGWHQACVSSRAAFPSSFPHPKSISLHVAQQLHTRRALYCQT